MNSRFLGLEFGGGETPRRPDFVQVDIRNVPGVNIVCNAWDIGDHYMEGNVPEIYSRHFMEHLTFEQAAATMKAWNHVLAPGGTVTTIVPDMDWHIAQWIGRFESEENLSKAIAGFWGKQRQGMTETWDVHKSGYDFHLLKKMLTTAGFIRVERLGDLPKNLTVIAKKA